jgi:hypothetical protein
MTKFKALHRAVQHLTDYQMNGRVVRRVAEYRAVTPDRENARQFGTRHGGKGQISSSRMTDGQMGIFAPRHTPTPFSSLPATGVTEATGRFSTRP